MQAFNFLNLKKIYSILLYLVSCLILVYLCLSVTYANKMQEDIACKGVLVSIQDSASQQLITKNDVFNLLANKGIQVKGKAIAHLPIDAIEDIVQGHPMVRTATCYPTTQHHLQIDITQRVPLLKVNNGVESYYIDTDHKRMPLSNKVDPKGMIVVSGSVGQRSAQNEIAELVEWVKKHRYWKDRIIGIKVVHPRLYKLQQANNEPYIVMEDIKQYEVCLNRLQKWYKGTQTYTDMPKYKELDLRYKDQVIGRK